MLDCLASYPDAFSVKPMTYIIVGDCFFAKRLGYGSFRHDPKNGVPVSRQVLTNLKIHFVALGARKTIILLTFLNVNGKSQFCDSPFRVVNACWCLCQLTREELSCQWPEQGPLNVYLSAAPRCTFFFSYLEINFRFVVDMVVFNVLSHCKLSDI